MFTAHCLKPPFLGVARAALVRACPHSGGAQRRLDLSRGHITYRVGCMPARRWVQPDLFGGPDVVLGPAKGKKKAPSTATNSQGAVTKTKRSCLSDEKCSSSSPVGQVRLVG